MSINNYMKNPKNQMFMAELLAGIGSGVGGKGSVGDVLGSIVQQNATQLKRQQFLDEQEKERQKIEAERARAVYTALTGQGSDQSNTRAKDFYLGFTPVENSNAGTGTSASVSTPAKSNPSTNTPNNPLAFTQDELDMLGQVAASGGNVNTVYNTMVQNKMRPYQLENTLVNTASTRAATQTPEEIEARKLQAMENAYYSALVQNEDGITMSMEDYLGSLPLGQQARATLMNTIMGTQTQEEVDARVISALSDQEYNRLVTLEDGTKIKAGELAGRKAITPRERADQINAIRSVPTDAELESRETEAIAKTQSNQLTPVRLADGTEIQLPMSQSGVLASKAIPQEALTAKYFMENTELGPYRNATSPTDQGVIAEERTRGGIAGELNNPKMLTDINAEFEKTTESSIAKAIAIDNPKLSEAIKIDFENTSAIEKNIAQYGKENVFIYIDPETSESSIYIKQENGEFTKVWDLKNIEFSKEELNKALNR